MDRRRLSCALLAGLLIAACASPGDPQRIAAHARAVKETAADATNVLLYLVGVLKVQAKEVEAVERGLTLLKSHPKAKDLRGFQAMSPSLVGLSETLRLTQPIRTEVKAAIERSRIRLGEIQSGVRALANNLATHRGALGRAAQRFDTAQAQLTSTADSLEKFVAAMTDYVEGAGAVQASARAALRELEILPRDLTIQEEAATIVRLGAFIDQVTVGLEKVAVALRAEVSTQDAGLASLLGCFRSLEPLADLPAGLAQEIREAVKLLDDVSKGLPFSPKPQ